MLESCLLDFLFLLSSASSVARGLFDNLLDRGAGLFAGVKNILPVSKDLMLTKIVDALLENRSIPEVEKYLYFDPKLAKKGSSLFWFDVCIQ